MTKKSKQKKLNDREQEILRDVFGDKIQEIDRRVSERGDVLYGIWASDLICEVKGLYRKLSGKSWSSDE